MRATTLTALTVLPLLALAACGVTNSTSLGQTKDAPPSVTATTQLLGPNGEMRGSARLEQRAGGTRVIASVEGLPAGPHGIHLHAVGKCDAPGFTTAGGHFNPTMKMHGSMNPMGPHEGDLPNVDVAADGKGKVEFTVPGLMLTGGTAPLLDADGAALVVHATADDLKTDPSGNSGGRIACGIIAAR
ncbi:superoxide dismutase family protein [Glacieibacterium sp.]|uniref:superoxide dismutase family protein n=1 Tax=Glacieibacterium sp. TaxID=2860237 RepID=UPI003AFFEDA5